VTRRCGDIVDKKQVNSCVQNTSFGGSSTTKKIAKNPSKAFSDALLMSRFQNFVADAAKKELHAVQFFETAALRAVLINEFIRINSGPKILRSCFLHRQRRHLSRGFLSLGKGMVAVRVFHILMSLSAISALERSREFTAAAAEAVNKKSWTSSIESLTSNNASAFVAFLTSPITEMTRQRRSAYA